jgi:hypothetical protein
MPGEMASSPIDTRRSAALAQRDQFKASARVALWIVAGVAQSTSAGCYAAHTGGDAPVPVDTSPDDPDAASPHEPVTDASVPMENRSAIVLFLDSSEAAETYRVLLYEIDGWVPPGCTGTTQVSAATLVIDWTCEGVTPATGTLAWDGAADEYTGSLDTIRHYREAHARWTDREPIVGTYELYVGDAPDAGALPGEPFAPWSPRLRGQPSDLPSFSWTDQRGLACSYRRFVFDGEGDDALLHVACVTPPSPDGWGYDHALIRFVRVEDGIEVGRIAYDEGSPGWQIEPSPCIVAVRTDLMVPGDLASYCRIFP